MTDVQLVRDGRLGRLAVIFTNRRGFVVEKSAFGGDAQPFRLPRPEGAPRKLECPECSESFLAYVAKSVTRLHCPSCGAAFMGGPTRGSPAATVAQVATARSEVASVPEISRPPTFTGRTTVAEAALVSHATPHADMPSVLAAAVASSAPRVGVAADVVVDDGKPRATRQVSLDAETHDAHADVELTVKPRANSAPIPPAAPPIESDASRAATDGSRAATGGVPAPVGDGFGDDFAGYRYRGYGLFKIGDGVNARYLFTRTKPESGEPASKPHGYEVGVNPRTGLPCLTRTSAERAIGGRLVRDAPRTTPLTPATAPSPLNVLRGIGPKRRALLEEAGYTSVDALVNADVDELAATAGVPKKTAESWTKLGGILAIPGVGLDEAAALLIAGVGSMKDLAGADASDLTDKVNEALAGREGGGVALSTPLVAAWITSAKSNGGVERLTSGKRASAAKEAASEA